MRLAWLGLLPVTLVALPAAGSDLTTPRETVLVERVLWPVYVREGRGARGSEVCDELSPEEFEVREDGKPVEVRQVEKRPLPIVHALLIDSSISMRDQRRLEHAKDAAVRYLGTLPEDELALVAAFDDSLRLRAPPTRDRERLETAIRGIRHGNATALWDALHDLIRYLDSLPGIKALVLLTDGADSSSLTRGGPRAILEQLARVSNLSIFPVRLNPKPAPGAAFLRNVASATGGLYFETRGASKLAAAFDSLAGHLRRRRFVVYEPNASEGQETAAWREVRVRLRKGVPCRLVDAGTTQRRVRRQAPLGEGWSPAHYPEGELPASVAALEQCLGLPRPWRVTHRRPLPRPEGWPETRGIEPSLYVLDPPGLLVGSAPDIVLDRGVLYQRHARRKGRFRISIDRAPEIAARSVAVAVPELEHVRRQMQSPSDVLLHAIRDPACAARLFVHGRTFLEMREFIGEALFRYHPEYRDWAAARIIREAETAVARLLDGRAEAERLGRIRQAMLEQTLDEPGDSPQRYLAEWLGDVPARELALDLELKLANAMLRGDDLPEPGRLWEQLHAWFPPATDVRVLTPLIPAYAPQRDVIGFYRVVLPRPNPDGPPLDPIPPLPFGLFTVRWMQVDAGMRVGSIDQARLSRRERRSLARSTSFAPRRGARRAEVELIDPGGTASLLVTAYFDPDARVPAVVRTCMVGEPSDGLRRLSRRLAELGADVDGKCYTSPA